MNKVKINYKIFNRGDLIMLSKDLLEALNDQMNHEYFAHAYMAMVLLR